jgi:hypothetical protein
MVDHGGIPEVLRKALARNRMLQDILSGENTAAHDALVRERCLSEIRRVARTRRWWRRASAVAAAAMVMATITGTWLLPGSSVTPEIIETVSENNIPAGQLLPPLVTNVMSPVLETVYTKPESIQLQIISTSSLQTNLATAYSENRSNRLVDSFSLVSTSELAERMYFSVQTNASLKGECPEQSTEKLDIKIAAISDAELLSLPNVIGIAGYAGNRRVLLNPKIGK